MIVTGGPIGADSSSQLRPLSDSMEQPLAQLPSLCSRTLQALYDRQAQTGEDGQLHSIDATTRTGATGPNVSFAMMSISGVTLVSTVGG